MEHYKGRGSSAAPSLVEILPSPPFYLLVNASECGEGSGVRRKGVTTGFSKRLPPGEAGVAPVPMRHRRFVIAPAKKDDLAVSLRGEVEQSALQVL